MGWEVLGGIGQGISQGTQDLERMREQAFLKKLRARQELEWAQEDAGDRALQAIPIETEVNPDANDAQSRRMGIAPEKKARPQADVLRDKVAALSAAGGRKNLKLGMDLQEQANRLSQQEIEDRSRRLGDLAKNAAWLHETGNHAGALRVLQGAYDMFPDGRKVVVDDNAGTWGVAAPNGKWEVAPVPITPESVGKAVNMGMKFGNPQLWSQFRGDERADKTLKLHERGADQKDREIGLHERKLNEVEIPLGKSHAGYFDAEAGLARAKAGAVGAEAKANTMGGTITVSNDDGTQTLVTPVLNKKTGEINYVRESLGGTNIKDPVRAATMKEWHDVEKEMIKQGSSGDEIAKAQTQFLARRGIAPPAASAVIQSGVNPLNKKPLTAKDVEEFNARYPKSKVDPATLPWLSGKMGISPPVRLTDDDGIPVPRAGRTVNPGYGTIDARGILETPSYSAKPNRFNPD